MNNAWPIVSHPNLHTIEQIGIAKSQIARAKELSLRNIYFSNTELEEILLGIFHFPGHKTESRKTTPWQPIKNMAGIKLFGFGRN